MTSTPPPPPAGPPRPPEGAVAPSSASGAPDPLEKIFIGPAGWSYRDWEGIVYPEGAGRARGWHALDYLAQWFPVVEINTSFYHIPPASSARSWVERASRHKDFLFTAKLWQGFTHGESGEKDGGGRAAAGWPRPTREDFQAFRAFLEPLASAGRLGGVLAQFPASWRPSPGARAWFETLAREFHDFPLAFEVRGADWRFDAYLDWLRGHNIAFVNIDQPLFENSLPPTDYVTSDFFYVRLHGRNRAHWWTSALQSEQRYNYMYSWEELLWWSQAARRMIDRAPRGFMITNNHFRGQAISNALELRAQLGRPAPPPPASLVETYPVLRLTLPNAGEPPPSSGLDPQGQMELF